MKTEREMFEDYYIEAYKNTDIGVLMDNGQYSSKRKQYSWDAWQASAQREGYKLVPVDKQPCCETMCSQCFKG